MSSSVDRPSAASSSPGLARHAWIAIGAGVALFVFTSSRSTLWDRDEPRFARAAVEMLRSGNWLVPTFNGEPRLHKPALIYWLMTLALRAFGAAEWSVRLVSPLGAACTAWFTFAIGRRWLGARVARNAVVVLLLAPMVFVTSTVATTDAVLCASITAAMACFAASLSSGWRSAHFVGLALALACAQLTKGPVGLILPLLAIVGAAWWLRRSGTLARGFGWRLALAAAISVALFLAWAIPANHATRGDFAREGLGHHFVERIFAPLEGHGGEWFLYLPYYVPVVALAFAPWLALLPAALAALFARRLGDEWTRALLVAWLAATFVPMSLVATKLPHYVLPMFPALALVTAAFLDRIERGAIDERDRRWLARGAWIYAFTMLVLVAACGYGFQAAPNRELRVACAVLGLVLALTATATIVLHRRGSWARAALVSGLGTLAAYLVAACFALPAVEPLKLAPRVAAEIHAKTRDDEPVAAFAFDEPSLEFYVDRLPIEHLPDERALASWCAVDAPGVLVAPVDRVAAALALTPIATVRGFNYSRGRWVELGAWSRR